jgi:hypothetical protein
MTQTSPSTHFRHRLLEERERAKSATSEKARQIHAMLALLYLKRLAEAEGEQQQAA